MSKPSPAITEALADASSPLGRERFFSLVYQDLARIARAELNRHRRGNTLNTRALINEAYLKLFSTPAFDFQNRAHFFGVAACAMRQVIIDYARARLAERRGGGIDHLAFESVEEHPQQIDAQAEQLLAIDKALNKLAELDQRLVKIIELRFFAGLGISEIAKLLGISEPTVKRDTRAAKAFMHQELSHLAS